MSLRWLPNAISLLRIALVVPVLSLILNGRYDWALLLFFIAGFSDGIDGYLANRFDWRTRVGALLDPVADKLLVAGTFLTLTYTQHAGARLDVYIRGVHLHRVFEQRLQ